MGDDEGRWQSSVLWGVVHLEHEPTSNHFPCSTIALLSSADRQQNTATVQ